MPLDFCNFIKEIQKDPTKKITDLTVGEFYQLQLHLVECQECSRLTDEILEEHKDHPTDLNSDWSKTQYN